MAADGADKHEAKRLGVRFVRKMLDAALEDAPEDVWGDPMRHFDNGRTLPLSLRLVRAISNAGYVMSAHSAGPKIIDGVRHRLELEDLFTGTLIAAGHSSLRAIQQNDQARDRLAEHLWDTLHQKHVILRRVKPPGELR